MSELDHTTVFQSRRRFLLGLAYRILGSRTEAEDAVQDTFLGWREVDLAGIDNPAAWLTTACTRRCLDLLKAAQRTRETYVGLWLPEPMHDSTGETAEDMLELSSTLSTAFLLLLERLAPKERAAYLLHDIFDVPYPDVAAMLGIQEPACRKLVSRAREKVGRGNARHGTPRGRQEELLAAFREAVATGVTDRFAALLSNEVALCADGGGRVPTIEHTLVGPTEVLAFVTGPLRGYWSDYQWHAADINGGRGVVLRQGGQAAAVVTFAWDEHGRAAGIYIVRNPEKLTHFANLRGAIL